MLGLLPHHAVRSGECIGPPPRSTLTLNSGLQEESMKVKEEQTRATPEVAFGSTCAVGAEPTSR